MTEMQTHDIASNGFESGNRKQDSFWDHFLFVRSANAKNILHHECLYRTFLLEKKELFVHGRKFEPLYKRKELTQKWDKISKQHVYLMDENTVYRNGKYGTKAIRLNRDNMLESSIS